MNLAILHGQLSSTPVLRELPSGSRVLNLELTTRDDAGAASVPLAWNDPPATVSFATGDAVRVVGSVRRRFFRAGGATQSRTEVVVMHICRADDKRALSAQRKLLIGLLGGDPSLGLT